MHHNVDSFFFLLFFFSSSSSYYYYYTHTRYGPLWFLRFRLLEKKETIKATLHHWAMFTHYLQHATGGSGSKSGSKSGSGKSGSGEMTKPAQFRLQLNATLSDLEKSTDYVQKN